MSSSDSSDTSEPEPDGYSLPFDVLLNFYQADQARYNANIMAMDADANLPPGSKPPNPAYTPPPKVAPHYNYSPNVDTESEPVMSEEDFIKQSIIEDNWASEIRKYISTKRLLCEVLSKLNGVNPNSPVFQKFWE